MGSPGGQFALVESTRHKQHNRSRVESASVNQTAVVSAKEHETQASQEIVEVPSPASEILVDECSAVDLDDDTFGDIIGETLSEDEQRLLQRNVIHRLDGTPGLPVEASTKKMLAEFVICMLLARKRPSDVLTELKVFLDSHTAGFVAWLMAHLKGPWLHA